MRRRLRRRKSQRRMTETAGGNDLNLGFRIGFHYGAAIETAGDVFGDSVNVAARMVGLAKRGQVILSLSTARRLSPGLAGQVRELDVLTVKGKEQDIGICELLWQDSSADLTAMAARPVARAVRLELRHGARTVELGAGAPALSLGRDAQNDVVIADRLASRQHARIERRRDKFVLVDQSSNGTYRDRRRRARDPAASRGDDPARPRPHQLRPRPRSGAGRSAGLRLHRRDDLLIDAFGRAEPAPRVGGFRSSSSFRSVSGFLTTAFCRPGGAPYSPAGGLVSSRAQHRRVGAARVERHRDLVAGDRAQREARLAELGVERLQHARCDEIAGGAAARPAAGRRRAACAGEPRRDGDHVGQADELARDADPRRRRRACRRSTSVTLRPVDVRRAAGRSRARTRRRSWCRSPSAPPPRSPSCRRPSAAWCCSRSPRRSRGRRT